ncbi:helix-turn-helix transcriptional regulator [Prescottella defluvii]|nr:helix-turn-helix transcriptional regulator [Prescottella defluvii]
MGEPQRLWREVVGEQIRQIRTDHAERLTDVASRAGVSPQYLSEIERGMKDPSSEVLAAVAGALGTSVEGLARRAYRLAPVLPLSAAASFAGGHRTAAGPVLLAA